ncbi:ABC transporter transmembrane domain-containing protein [Luteolibacter flavescens]|uniref:ABC transporter transmembrane domain-containing protein n=1 Tax=Luteolibacter flavescens TaxID=1859460 RepID=A0ABT3FQU0_9BACT|nr:SbmA/BacA-like family transporter [Luteolibacter flavescens]MCW1885956.1 ABC transporter transmembrane domain-containing protein [Luteolibacter flavescens]
MPEKKPAVTREILRRLGRVVWAFLRSKRMRGKAWFLLLGLLILMLVINGMNVLNSYVGRDFFSAIERRDSAGFALHAWRYVGVFAASTVVAVFFRYCEERLALLWREWQTQRVVRGYLNQHIYLHIKQTGSITNPDQRMTEDIRSLTTTSLSFLLMILNGTFTAISFSGVLWSISPILFGVAVLYAAIGSGLTILLGRPLIRLNYQQADREADFRSELISVHQEAEGLAFTRDEARMKERLGARIDQLVLNYRKIVAVNRNLNFFTNGYNYMIQLIPALFVAPMFIAGGVEFGVIGQATMAFATLVGAFSLIITQFQSISSYASVVTRLSELMDASESAALRNSRSCLGCSMDADRIVFSKLSLKASEKDDRILLADLDVTFDGKHSVLITGPNPAAKAALFHATAGLHDAGSGSIHRPPKEKLAFVLERPYLPAGSLREFLTPPDLPAIADHEILAILDDLGLVVPGSSERDFDTSRQWDDELNLAEGQLLAVARALLTKPDFILLDHLDAALDAEEFRRVRQVISRRGVAAVVFGNGKTSESDYDAVLEIHPDATWSWRERVITPDATSGG